VCGLFFAICICSVFVLQIVKIQNENTTFERKMHFGFAKPQKAKQKL